MFVWNIQDIIGLFAFLILAIVLVVFIVVSLIGNAGEKFLKKRWEENDEDDKEQK